MKKYLKSFFSEFDYSEKSQSVLNKAYDSIYENVEASALFDEVLAAYDASLDADFDKINETYAKIAAITDIHSYTVGLLTYICLSKRLREYYRIRGISDEIFYNSMLDLKYKLKECELVKGIVGSFVCFWFPRFFKMTRFALGRLQFEINTWKRNYTKGNKTIKEGDPVINVHIPRTETPLLHEDCQRAYAMAANFFKDSFKETPVAFCCHSWLLMPELSSLLKETSNIKKFASDFDIIENGYRDQGVYNDVWRLFDMDYNGDLTALPENTSLRRIYKQYLIDGGREGYGLGIFFA